jgi:hypothetical protein
MKVSCLIVMLVFISISNAIPHAKHSNQNELSRDTARNDVDKNDDFDYLVFRQIWPQPTCMFPGQHSCSIAKNITSWVVHGLWYLMLF